MTRPDGTPVNAVFGFTNMLAKLLKDHVGTHIAVIFDAGRLTFRNRIYEAYKAHRPPPPDELIPQFALVREATAAFGVPAIELADWEADDLIASYARAAVECGGQATIVSSDKDLMQLIRPGVGMLDPIKQKPIGPAEVMEKFGVAPEKLIEVQALMGDSVDNVPGVPGIGPKTAAQLIDEFGDLEAVLAAAPAMKPSKRRDALIEHAEAARISRELVTLRDDAPLPVPVDELQSASRPSAPRWPHGSPRRASAASPRGWGWTGRRRQRPRQAAAAAGRQGELGLSDDAPAPIAAPAVQRRFGPYETVTTEAALAGWVAEAIAPPAWWRWTPRPTGSMRCGRGCWAFRWPPRRAAPAMCRCATTALETQLTAIGRWRRGAGAAAGRSLRAEGAAERQVRHAAAAAPRLPAGRAARRYDADLLQPGGRAARPRHGRAVGAASGPHADQL